MGPYVCAVRIALSVMEKSYREELQDSQYSFVTINDCKFLNKSALSFIYTTFENDLVILAGS